MLHLDTLFFHQQFKYRNISVMYLYWIIIDINTDQERTFCVDYAFPVISQSISGNSRLCALCHLVPLIFTHEQKDNLRPKEPSPTVINI